MFSPILQPAIVLVLWTFVMWAWLYATRIPAMQAAKAPLDPNATSAEFNAGIPPQVRWKADNYNHLHEQPTLFYAVVAILALSHSGSGWNLWLAWGYVGVRVVHSLIQSLGNVILARFSVFMIGSVVLLILALRAAMAVFGLG